MTNLMPNYFDYAAATPISPTVLTAMQPYFVDNFYNPSAQYLAAKQVRSAVENARASVAAQLGVRPAEIIFTAGGTEANNLAVHGVMAQHPSSNCIVSAIEHDSVLEPASQYDCKIAPVLHDGMIDIEALSELIDEKTVLVSIMYANNEIGTYQLLPVIAKLLQTKRQERVKLGNTLPLLFHSDACQTPNYLAILSNTLGVDMMSLNGGKIYGPKQSGVLFVKNGISLQPIIYGGGQEKNVRSGTENVAGIVGFTAALQETARMRDAEVVRLKDLQHFAQIYITENIPSIQINGSKQHKLVNNLHITMPGFDNERVMMQLDEMGFQVAIGSACSASNDEPSHVLKAIGLSEADAQSSLRITMGRYTTRDSLLALLSSIKSITEK